ncbi:DUF92 domain-containing protein [Neobacillus massiliamazoniensis]|jgi:uncharacterized protein (TIGR00297 family)|uniref:Integral membrane protein n=1 Tax=Neobacillus massiliamazoniensis TaxID=1499688 RepID=A0A0U1P1K6_9BACI|nr:DUF92 domain-containing protein [Neobacillus massiliamazoniensis]CRK84136.1 integral membrane protein [Neobacillus massiliamazoniensis]
MIENLFILIIIILISYMGYLLRSLSFSGTIAAIFVGMAIYAGYGVKGLILLGVFFATSSFWSKYKAASKSRLEEKLAKGARRDWRQVIANGGGAALFSMLSFIHYDKAWLIGFIVCLASANSDTWASEIGSLSKKNPIDIRSFVRVEKGTSGAISLLGSTAALFGSLIISISSLLLFQLSIIYGVMVFLFGYIGNVLDTLIGAYYQQLYRCNECGIETEKKFHCHSPTKRIKGIAFVDNDMVNFLSGFLAAILAIVVFMLTK